MDVLIAIGSLGTLAVLILTLLWNLYVTRPWITVGPFRQTDYSENLPRSVSVDGQFLLQSKTPVSTELLHFVVELSTPQLPAITSGGGRSREESWSVLLRCERDTVYCPFPIPGSRAAEFELGLYFYKDLADLQGRPVVGEITLQFMHGRKTIRIEAQAAPLDD